nr:unnamed protein product [Callosobruchus analis]
MMPRYLTDEELAQLVEDVSCIEEEDEVQGELFDDLDDIDYESQHTDVSDHDSDSQVDMDPTEGDHDGVAKAEMDDLEFYIGKGDENVWLRSLRFDNVNTRTQRSKTDKLAPIRDFLTNFISNSQSSYNIGECATIDEMLVAFRGRCSFIQYMAKKPAKYGLKIYAMCHSQTYYTYNLEIYCGIQEDGPHVCSNKPFDLVKRLVKPLEKSNRNITTDNYFSSIQLADYLLTIGLTFLRTLRKNKAEIPPPFVTENRNLVPGDYLFGCQDGKTLVSLVKVVLVLSTLHDTDTVDELTGKPIQIADYNSTKGGVDTVDLMCSRITTSRRWPMNIFFRLLDIAGINSFRIFQMNNPFDKTIRRKYLYNLSLELMQENLKERAKLRSLLKDLSLFLESYREPTVHESPLQTQPNQRVIYHMCGSKRTTEHN